MSKIFGKVDAEWVDPAVELPPEYVDEYSVIFENGKQSRLHWARAGWSHGYPRVVAWLRVGGLSKGICACDQLMPGLQAINSRLHHAGPYTQPPFVFCPWCGDRITEEIKMHPDVIAATVEYNKELAAMTKEELQEKFNSFDKYIADAEMTNPAEESQKGEE